jgi:hypothetical protein
MKTKYPVVRHSSTMLQDWSTPLAERAGVSAAEFLKNPERHLYFPIETVRVELMDGSHAEFKYAFFLVAAELKAIAVFTEHCGHHVFPHHEAKVFRAGKLTYENSEA